MYIPPPVPELPVTCHLCSVPILNPPSSPRPGTDRDMMSFSWDHVIPLTAGGGDEPENLRPAHLVCNIRRANMPLEEWFATDRWKDLPQRPSRGKRPKQLNTRIPLNVYAALVETSAHTGVPIGRLVERGIILECQQNGFGSDLSTPRPLTSIFSGMRTAGADRRVGDGF